jgi:type 1 glutamine amidotransferase
MMREVLNWLSQIHSARRARFCVLAAAAAFVWSAVAVSAEPPKPAKPIKVLLVTGAEYHNWRETAPVLAAQLRKDPRIDVRVIEDAFFLDSPAVDRYDVIFLNYMNFQVPGPGEAAKENLKKAISGGKGLVLVHFACGAWQDWPEFKNLAGRVWDPKLRGHDPHGKFRVDIAMPEHPIVKGFPSFETVDELYTCLTGDRPIDIVATAQSKVDGKTYPMAFCFNYGKGRVFHCVLGHDGKALENPPVGELFRRGTAWAAGQSVR